MLGRSRDLSVHRPPGPSAWQTARPGNRKGCTMTEASVSFAGDLTDDPELRTSSAASPGSCSGGVRSAGAGGVVLMRDLADRAIA